MSRLSEAECQRRVILVARRAGWLVHHQRPAINKSGKWSSAIQGDVGFPDLVLVHERREILLFVELKRKPAKLSDGQVAWQNAIENVGQWHEIWWVPEELEERLEWLTSGYRRG